MEQRAVSRRALVSIGAGPQRRLLALAQRSFRPYAKRHGYDLVLRDESPSDGRPPAWGKVVLLRQLAQHYETLVWLDADLVIVDGRRDIALELEDGHDIAMAEHSYGGSQMLNSGVMVLRGGEPATSFLDAIWSLDEFTHHRWWENAAICSLLGYELDPPRPSRTTAWREATTLLDPRWNSIRDAPAARPYIRHYPGYSIKTRALFMARDLAISAARGRLR